MDRQIGTPAMGAKSHERYAIVLGSNEVGSAVALALHWTGWKVVLIDHVDPGNPWRGMSFTDAWYMGSCELGGVAACFCTSVRSIPSVLRHGRLIAATTWSWRGVVQALPVGILVDARTANGGLAESLKRDEASAPIVVGCGTGHQAGSSADVIVDTAFDRTSYSAVATGSTSMWLGARPPLAGTGDERFVVAPCTGRFRTQSSFADMIDAREPIGDVSGQHLAPPLRGVLRGITARGAKVMAGEIVAEIDARGDPSLCYGVDARAGAIADALMACVAKRRDAQSLPARPRPAVSMAGRGAFVL